MKKQTIVISRGPFKGKTIEFASTSGVDALTDTSEEFMKKILDLDPGTYLISDESRLRDFVGIEERDLTDIYERIRTEYGLDVSRLRSGNLLAIYSRESVGRRHFSGPLTTTGNLRVDLTSTD